MTKADDLDVKQQNKQTKPRTPLSWQSRIICQLCLDLLVGIRYIIYLYEYYLHT